MPRSAAIVTHDFAGAAAALGAPNWGQLNTAFGGEVERDGAGLAGGSNSHSDISLAPVARFVGTGSGDIEDDQWATIDFLVTAFESADYGMGVIARATADTDGDRDYYYVYAASNDTYKWGKVVNGTHTSFGTGAQAWNNGDSVEIECEGTTIRFLRNGSQIASTTDSALTAGAVGVLANGDSFVAPGDNFEGGNMVASADEEEALTGSASTSASGTAAPVISIGL